MIPGSRFLNLLAASMAVLGLVAGRAQASPIQGRGLDVPLADAATALEILPPAPSTGPRALLRVDLVPGAETYEADARALRELARAAAGRARVIVALREPALVDVRDGAALDSWVERVALLADAMLGGETAWEIRGDDGRPEAEEAFFLKRTALAIKGVDRAAQVLNAQPRAWPGGSLNEGVAPFVDGHAAPAGAEVQGIVLRTGQAAGTPEAAWQALVESAVAGVPAATLSVPGDALRTERARLALAFATWFDAFPEDASPTGNAPLVTFPPEASVTASELVVASDLSTRVVYLPGWTHLVKGTSMLVTFDEAPASLRIFDPLGGRPGPRPVPPEDGASPRQRIVPFTTRPLVLAWDRTKKGDDLQEDVDVSILIEPTVEEVLARHLAAQAARDRALRTYTADLVTEMRYEMGSTGQAFDVRVEGRYFHSADGMREVENRRFVVNGAPYEPKKGRAPEIPLLQPEKVQVLPLELRMDKSYEYRLLGKDERNGRPCWKVALRPVSSDVPGHVGTVWIDATTWDRVALDLVQTGLTSPVLTNEQIDDLGPVLGDDGEHWLVQESRIHRTVSLLGASVGIQMRLVFSNFRVNDPGFDAERGEALASTRQMLRDTDEGLQYLRPAEGGSREIAESSSRKIFVIAGARYDGSHDGVLPLGGVNWLDYDLAGRGLQMNLFAAGAINTLSLADPSLFGGKTTLALDAFVPFVKRRDRLALPGTGVDEDEIARSRAPRVEVELSRPIGRHGRAAITTGLSHESWSRDDDAAPDFVAPVDTWVASLGGRGEIHRKGWDGRIWLTRYERQDWEPWGRDDGSGLPPVDDDQGYWKWGASLERTWPLSRLQTIGFDARALGGSGLDRFSQHEFSALGTARLPGFDGSGIHFDEAALVRLSWGVDIAGVLGVQLQVGAGRTWNRTLPDAVAAEWGEEADHVGVAVAGTLPGPWGSLVRFDVGTIVRSPDHADLEGELVASILVLKLLGR